MKKLIVLLLFATCSLIAQPSILTQGYDTSIGKNRHELKELDKQTIKLSVKILIDNKYEEHDDFTIKVINKTQGYPGVALKSPSDITIFLYYDNEYDIQFSRVGCSTTTIHFNGNHVPYDNWQIITELSLSSNNNMQLDAGGIKYNTARNTFDVYKHY